MLCLLQMQWFAQAHFDQILTLFKWIYTVVSVELLIPLNFLYSFAKNFILMDVIDRCGILASFRHLCSRKIHACCRFHSDCACSFAEPLLSLLFYLSPIRRSHRRPSPMNYDSFSFSFHFINIYTRATFQQIH